MSLKSKQFRAVSAESLNQAVQAVYQTTGYAFQSSPWFIDVKDRFRIFKFDNKSYIAKRTSLNKALDEVEKCRQASIFVGGKTIENRILQVVVPETITIDENNTYVVSAYAGADLNESSYQSIAPQLTAKQYVNIVHFLRINGVAHPGFLPRNIVEKEDKIFLFDWEDATFHSKDEHIHFDRLWYTNFILNWSYLFPREELDHHINKILAGTQLTEPPLVRYEQAFRDVTGIDEVSVTNLRDIIEIVVFEAELPTSAPTYEDSLQPNDLGHLFADIFFDEIDVLGDMASKAMREHNEKLYISINGLISHIIRLCQNSDLKDINFYASIGILLLIDLNTYTKSDYDSLLKQSSLDSIVNSLKQKNQDSLAVQFINGLLNEKRIDSALRTCIQSATGIIPPVSSSSLDRITDYFITMQERVK